VTAIAPGTHALGPADGQLLVKIYREGAAARLGHDITFEVRSWTAELTVDGEDLSKSTIEASAQVPSFSVFEATGGAKPLSRGDQSDIKRNIEEKVLSTRSHPSIDFRSTGVMKVDDSKATLNGELTIAGRQKPVTVQLTMKDGKVRAAFQVVQSQWGIKPFSAMMGALKVKDSVDVILEVDLPAS
jgi:polyisoprenoid-binding protein YceI